MVLYRNTKSFVRFPDGETEFLDILAEVLQGDTLTPFLFIICLDYVLTISVDKCNEYGRTLELERSRRLPTKKITDAVILLITHISIVTALMVLYRNTKSLVLRWRVRIFRYFSKGASGGWQWRYQNYVTIYTSLTLDMFF